MSALRPAARFAGRVVYVTGAASGIGRATAELFGTEGARVFAVDVNGQGVRATVDTICGAGGMAAGGACDVADLDAVQRSVADAVRTFGGLNVLVNAAGVGRAVRFEEIDEHEWQRVLSVNLTGVFNTTRAALEHLLREPGGNIVNVASTAALRGHAYASHYAASKAGMLNFTRSVALEFASRGLRANCVCPAGVRTPLIMGFQPREDFEAQLIAYYSPPVPGMLWEPQDVARQIAYLASSDAHMINGAALIADGGTLA